MNNNESNISLRFKNYVTGEAKLEKYEKRLKNIQKLIKSMPKNVNLNVNGLNDYSEQLDTIINKLDKTTTISNKTQKNLNSAFSVASLGTFIASMKKAVVTLTGYTEKSTAFLENINLYQVAFNGAYEEADKFVNKLTEMYGLDENWLVRNVGLFKQLANAMGLANDTSSNLSMLLTQMAIDISSLYNVGIERASSVLQSAMAGQTKPIRGATGADITMATLQKTLSDLGIDRYIGNLSYAEKRLVTIISLTNQLSEATNDFGRTIESPANQLRILSEQWERMTRAMGNLFLPILGKILPYLNAILMVITEIINTIAIFLGFNIDDYDYFAGVSDSVLELEDNLNSAGESAKKLKSGLRGFDKLNVITTPSATSSGIAGGGVSSDILDAFNNSYEEYMKKIENVQMKATKIRDTLMEWLGFTKQIDEETGKVSFKFEKITGGTILGALVVGGSIFLGVRKIFSLLKIIGGGISSIGGSTSKNTFQIPNISTILKGIAELGLIIGACTILVTAYGGLAKIPGFTDFVSGGVELMVKVFEGIGKIFVPLIGISVISAGLGLLSSIVLPGLGVLALIIAGCTAVVSAYGGLAKISGIQEFVSSGIDLLCSIFEGIGKIIGVLIGGTIEMISASVGKSLENFGLNLSNFMENAKPFFENSDSVNSKSTEAIKNIADTILILTASNILEGLTKWLVGKTSLVEFGKELNEFAPHFKSFANSIKNIPKETLENTKIITKTMMEIVEFSKEIPNSGGLLGLLAGNNDLSDFSKMLPTFGKNIKSYGDNIKGLQSDVDTNSEKIKNAMVHIIEFAKKIPNEGGVAGFFAGNNNIADFGKNLKDFGKYFKEYSDNIKNISLEKINSVTSSLEDIVKTAKQIKDNGLSSTIKDFSQSLKNSASNIKSFYDNALSYNNGFSLGKEFGNGIANAISSALKNTNFPKIKITDTSSNQNIGTYKISTYAQGGLPPVGQIFIANERGPELVGQIGGQSFVANQNQILDLVKGEIATTKGINNATFIFKVGDEEVARYIINNLQDMAKSNGKPIQIGG